jgi:undecaprenyl diphosphate synthase
VEFVTLYALSTENLSRPKDEVEGLFNLMREYFSTNLQRLQSAGIKLKVIGDRTLLPSDIVELIEKGEEGTSGGKKGVLTLAIAYGGRQEIAAAAALAAKEGEVSPETLSRHLQTAELPDPDLIIRTGKEQRISNFLLWQSAYAELYFSGKMFPDFSPKEFDKALKDYAGRDRRYGRVTKDGE